MYCAIAFHNGTGWTMFLVHFLQNDDYYHFTNDDYTLLLHFMKMKK